MADQERVGGAEAPGGRAWGAPAVRRPWYVTAAKVAIVLGFGAGVYVTAAVVTDINYLTGFGYRAQHEYLLDGDQLAAGGQLVAAIEAYSRARAAAPDVEIDRKIAFTRLRRIAEDPDLLASSPRDLVEFEWKWLLARDAKYYGAVALTVAGHIALSRGELVAARDFYKRAILVDGAYGPSRLGLAMADLRGGDVEAARAGVAAAVAHPPPNAAARLLNGDLLVGTDPQKAEREYRASIEVRETAAARRGIGRILQARGEADAAIEEFRKAVSLDPGDAASAASIASILSSSGRVEAETRAIEAAVAVRPDPALAAILAAIRTLPAQ
jgi:tetratricopeptide (TPR) repeat protein